MKTRTKKVRVSVDFRPITNLSTGVILSRGTWATMVLSEQDIFRCICGKAVVEEEMPDGSFIKLDLFNYNKSNNIINDSDEDEKENSDSSVPAQPLVKEPEPKNSAETVLKMSSAPQFINPNVAPVSQKELINPANMTGTADPIANDLESSDGEANDADVEQMVEEETENGATEPNNMVKPQENYYGKDRGKHKK